MTESDRMQPSKRPSTRSRSTVSFTSRLQTLTREWDEKLRKIITDVTYKLKHLPQANFELGQRFANNGNVNDAMFRFRIATWFAPNFARAWYNLGCCQLALGKKPLAIASFRKVLALEPNNTEAIFMLATIDPSLLSAAQQPQHMPVHMVEGFFSQVASQYDLIEGKNSYVAPRHLHTRVAQMLTGRAALRILDLGCGTGLAAMPWRESAAHITGIDITKEMTERARIARVAGVNVYDDVLTCNANQSSAPLPTDSADLVIALNILPYLGECSAFLNHAARALKPNGIFALTLEPYPRTDGFGVVPATSRFGHGSEYITRILASAGLTRTAQETITLYPETKVPLLIFSAQKV
jgi:predicted TPR repeat methyltransferase